MKKISPEKLEQLKKRGATVDIEADPPAPLPVVQKAPDQTDLIMQFMKDLQAQWMQAIESLKSVQQPAPQVVNQAKIDAIVPAPIGIRAFEATALERDKSGLAVRWRIEPIELTR